MCREGFCFFTDPRVQVSEDPKPRTGLDLARVRRNRVEETFHQLYDGKITDRYNSDAIALEASDCSTDKAERQPATAKPFTGNFQEVFGLDPEGSFIDNPRASHESGQGPEREKVSASLFRGLKSPADERRSSLRGKFAGFIKALRGKSPRILWYSRA
jgi:hypothetical protein